MKKRLSVLLSIVICLGLVAGCGTASSASAAPAQASGASEVAESAPAAFTPGKTVEVIVPNSAGGGTDIFARKVIEIINQYDMVPGTTFEVINKGGASGTIGGAYVLSQKGNDDILIFCSTAFWTTPISGTATYSYTEFTPLVEMSTDVLVLAVGKNSGYSTIEEFIEAAKSGEGAVSIAGSSVTSEGGLLNVAFQDEIGCITKWVPYESGGDAVTAVMGGHVDATWTNYGEIQQQIETGDLVILAAATPERLEGLPDVPTMQELGYNVEIEQHRHIAGAPEMSEEAIAFYDDLFQRVYDTPEFTEYIENNMLTPGFVPHAQWAQEYLEVGEYYQGLFDKAQELGLL